MKFVIALAYNDPASFPAIAQVAEQSGFHGVVLSDHVVHPERIDTPYPYTSDGNTRWPPFTPWPDPFVAIGAMAAVTSRLRFLTSIYVLPLRSPLLAAKTIGTAAVMSGNRVDLGVGAGWMREEFELMGQPFGRRGRRLEEMLEILRKLWAGGMVEHEGEFYRFDRLEMSPTPTEPVPIFVGGVSELALRRAARIGDGWASEIQTKAQMKEITTRLAQYRLEGPRAGEPFEICAAVKDAFAPDHYEEMAQLGVTQLLTVPWLMFPDSAGSLEAQCDAMRRFGEEVVAPLAEAGGA